MTGAIGVRTRGAANDAIARFEAIAATPGSRDSDGTTTIGALGYEQDAISDGSCRTTR